MRSFLILGLMPLFGGFALAAQNADVQLVSANLLHDSTGMPCLIGIVVNGGDQNFGNVKVTVIWYADNTPVAADSTYTDLHILKPDELSSFIVEGLNVPLEMGKQIDGYKLFITCKATSRDPRRDVKIISSQGMIDEKTKTFVVRGKIRNTNSVKAAKVTITAVFFDQEGKIIGWGDDPYLAFGDPIPPNATVDFLIWPWVGNLTFARISFSLFVQVGNELDIGE